MSDASGGNSVEAWVLMGLVHKDLDDFDYENALLLAERLYALDKENENYRFLYAKCLFVLQDYNASYQVLKSAKSIPCLNLFAKSCLELGKLDENIEGRRYIWNEGAQALVTALDLYDETMPEKHQWGDDLASVTTRTHVPSRASLLKLLGELLAKLDNIRASFIYLWRSLKDSAFKLSAYNLICDIAPDVTGFDTAGAPDAIFKDLSNTASLDRSPDPFLPGYPTPSKSTLHTATTLPSRAPSDTLYMPFLRNDYQEVTLEHLRALVSRQQQEPFLDPQRGEIEIAKDEHIAMLTDDIRKDNEEQSYKNKHGLHKRPTEEKPQQLQVHLSAENFDAEMDVVEVPNIGRPPRVLSTVFDDGAENRQDQTNIKERLRKVKKHTTGNIQTLAGGQKNETPKNSSLFAYFNIDHAKRGTSISDKSAKETILAAMNNILHVIRALANGYLYQSFHQCQKAVLELQKLDDRQYDTPTVLYLLGKAYYDVSNYKDAVVFFRRGILIAPWFCKGVPLYSTCLWYLEKERELNLLAYVMKGNRSHLYEAYIAAGNWSKYARGGNEAMKWFQKAVELDPSRSYGHHLLGYEETEKGNWLRAKVHFANCMIANKRSYLGWFGMATAYQGMEQYPQAKALLQEALRLHPYNPVVLDLMAEVLFALHEYEPALEHARKSLEIRSMPATEKLIEKILNEMNNPPLDTLMGMDEI